MGMRLQAWALVWGVPGFAIQCFGIAEGWVLASLGGTALLCVGLMYHIRGKGYHPMWGLWGLVPIMGPVLLLLQPRRPGVSAQDMLQDLLVEEDPHVIRSFGRQDRPTVSGGLALLLAMAPVGIMILLFSARLPHAVAPGEVAAPPTPAATTGVAPGPVAETVAEPPLPTSTPSPLPSGPATQELTTPPEAPAAAPEEVAEPPPPVVPASFQESPYEAKYRQLHPGMTYEQVCDLVGNDSTLISGKLGAAKIVKWENPDKSFFAARFHNNALDRMTGLNYPPPPKELEEMAKELRAPGEEAVPLETEGTAAAANIAQEEEGPSAESAPQEEAKSADEGEELPSVEGGPGEGEEITPEEAPPAKKNVVRVGGETPAGPRRRKAQLPRYTQDITRGPNDVYIHNETDTTVNVGLRTQTKRGTNLTVAPGGMVTIYLMNGTYKVFYIETSHPYDLKSAGDLVIASPPGALHVVIR